MLVCVLVFVLVCVILWTLMGVPAFVLVWVRVWACVTTHSSKCPCVSRTGGCTPGIRANLRRMR